LTEPAPGLFARWAGLLLAGMRLELRLRFAQFASLLHPLAFAVLVAILFGLALGPNPDKLALVAPAALLLALLLAHFLSLEQLFSGDLDDGSLDAIAASGTAWVPLLYGKALAFWLAQGLALLLALPVLMLLLNLPIRLAPVLCASFILLSLALSFLGLIAAALTVRLRAGAMLLILLVLPQAVPLLIFALGAVNAAVQGQAVASPLLYLAAITLLLIAFGPLAAKGALSQDTSA
jgi:heme exporter protein B